MKPDEYKAELERALDEYRFEDVGSLTEKIIPTEFQDRQIKIVLNMIRRKRLFAELERVAGLFMGAGRATPVVRRQWAQALLDQKRVTQALDALQALYQEVKQDPVEGSEVLGLIGRAYKQLYVNEGNREHLVKAIQAYTPFWKSRQGDYKWHGINLAALLARARRDEVDPQTSDDQFQIAREIRDEIEKSSKGDVWDCGTAMEASVALGDEDGAVRWAAKFVKQPEADAFEYASTLRQLKELWQLEETPFGMLLPVLRYALLNKTGGSLEPTALKDRDLSGFEAVWGAESYRYLEWMDTMYKRCAAIARVFDPDTGIRWGTGFLVRGDKLNQSWGEEPVFVTNAHVVSNDAVNEAKLKPHDAWAEFTRLPGCPRIKLGDELFTSRRIRLDVSILRIAPPAPAGAEVLDPTDFLPATPKPGEKPQRIYIIGHPQGGNLAVSLYDNSLVGYEGDYVHYRSPTEGGHSGSPVFTQQWKLIAIHHRAREEKQCNEGVCFEPICVAARSGLKS